MDAFNYETENGGIRTCVRHSEGVTIGCMTFSTHEQVYNSEWGRELPLSKYAFKIRLESPYVNGNYIDESIFKTGLVERLRSTDELSRMIREMLLSGSAKFSYNIRVDEILRLMGKIGLERRDKIKVLKMYNFTIHMSFKRRLGLYLYIV